MSMSTLSARIPPTTPPAIAPIGVEVELGDDDGNGVGDRDGDAEVLGLGMAVEERQHHTNDYELQDCK